VGAADLGILTVWLQGGQSAWGTLPSMIRFEPIGPPEERDARRRELFEHLDQDYVTGSWAMREVYRHAHLDDIQRWMGHPKLAGEVAKDDRALYARPILFFSSSSPPEECPVVGQWVVWTWKAAPRIWMRPRAGGWGSPEWGLLEELEHSLHAGPDPSLVDWAAGHEAEVARGWGVLGRLALGNVDGLRALASDDSAQISLLAASCLLQLDAWSPEISRAMGRWLLELDARCSFAVELLGRAGDASWLPRLVEIARTPTDHGAPFAAVDALRDLGAVGPLVDMMDLPRIHRKVLRALQELGPEIAPYADVFLGRFRAGDRPAQMAHLLACSGPAGESIIDDLVRWFVEAEPDPVFGLLTGDAPTAAHCLARLGAVGWRELERLLDEDDVERFSEIARAFASVGAAPPAVRARLWAATTWAPSDRRTLDRWGWVLLAVATFDVQGLLHVARIYADLVDGGLEPSNHHATPASFQALGAELARSVPPLLRVETDRDRAWRWVRALGAVGGHLTEAGREALEHEALSIDSERAANARRVLRRVAERTVR
jgi:hypothetical protein